MMWQVINTTVKRFREFRIGSPLFLNIKIILDDLNKLLQVNCNCTFDLSFVFFIVPALAVHLVHVVTLFVHHTVIYYFRSQHRFLARIVG